MLTGTMLQNRYRILQQIGGGGMGIVYLAEDTRLPGRHCAIKEVSPSQLPPQDVARAVQTFQQEAQLLARLSHPGLTAVTDFFSEWGNWYLVMEYVEGITLDTRLEQMPGRPLPPQEALSIFGQLCDVLEYLHRQNPPVIFRDLKPSNVMLTPHGQVRLIDFGIARVFKPGRTRDTVNLGTPGYAAPEQYGGKGQTDPRTDIYSLGVLLHQMFTGYDPMTTPFALPDPARCGVSIPPNVVDAIRRATQADANMRFATIDELRRAVWGATAPIGGPTPSMPLPSARPNLMPVAIGALVILLILVSAGVYTLGRRGAATPTVGVATPVAMTQRSSPPSSTIVSVAPPMPTATRPPTVPPAPEPTPSRAAKMQWTSIGRSVQGRDLSMTIIGDRGQTAVLIVGSIQGDQPNTRDLVNALVGHFERNLQQVPTGVDFYLLPSLNPDGIASNSRYNAHGVDINRNWDASDWRSDAAVPDYPNGKPGAGGSSSASEPETRALRDYMLQLRSRVSGLRVVVIHSSVRRSEGEVYAGGDIAQNLARSYASAASYNLQTSGWDAYTTTGELITWCAEKGILSIDVVIPGSQKPSTQVPGTGRTLLEITAQAILQVANYR